MNSLLMLNNELINKEGNNIEFLNNMIEDFQKKANKLFEHNETVMIWNLAQCYEEIINDYNLDNKKLCMTSLFFNYYIQNIWKTSLNCATKKMKIFVKNFNY